MSDPHLNPLCAESETPGPASSVLFALTSWPLTRVQLASFPSPPGEAAEDAVPSAFKAGMLLSAELQPLL